MIELAGVKMEFFLKGLMSDTDVKQHIVRIALGLAIALFFLGHAARPVPRSASSIQLDNIIYDARLGLTMPRGVDERIVILDIDEKSLRELGPLAVAARPAGAAHRQAVRPVQIAVVGFDVVFAERDDSAPASACSTNSRRGELKEVAGFQQADQKLRPQLDYDELFAQAIKGRPVVLGYYLNNERGAQRIACDSGAGAAQGHLRRPQHRLHLVDRLQRQPAGVPEGAASAGHFNPLDRRRRRSCAACRCSSSYDGAYYEALSLAMVRTLARQFPKRRAGIRRETGFMQAAIPGWNG